MWLDPDEPLSPGGTGATVTVDTVWLMVCVTVSFVMMVVCLRWTSMLDGERQ